MGKIVAFAFFIIAFIVFAIIKAVFFGVKEAYKAVFDPNSGEKEIQKIIEFCFFAVNDSMSEFYDGKQETLSEAITELTPMVQSTILRNGYQASYEHANSIVKQAIITGGYATKEEVDRA